MDMELISVIIPTRNRREFLQQAVESVRSQTYDNIEIIVINEASQDDTNAYLKNIEDPRLKVITHSTPQGGNIARNKGFEISRGSYVAFLDDDDIWEKTKLEKQYKVFKKNNSVGLVTCSSLAIYQNWDIERYMNRGSNYLYSNNEAFHKMLKENFIGGASFPLIKRECLQEVEGFRPGVTSSQETDLYLRILAKGYAVYAIEEVLVLYRVHSMNRISDNLEAKTKGLQQLFEYKKENLLNEISPQEAGEIEQIHVLEVCKIYTRNRKFKAFLEYYNAEKRNLLLSTKIKIWRNFLVHTPLVQMIKKMLQKKKTSRLNNKWKPYLEKKFYNN